LWHLPKCLQYILDSLLPSHSFIPPPHLLRIVSAGLITPFSYMSTYFIFSLLNPFLMSSPVLLILTSRQDLFYLPVLHFWDIVLCFR
jgi:hypothetical protein